MAVAWEEKVPEIVREAGLYPRPVTVGTEQDTLLGTVLFRVMPVIVMFDRPTIYFFILGG